MMKKGRLKKTNMIWSKDFVSQYGGKNKKP